MKIVVDANIALALVMPLAYSEQAHRQFAIWVKDRAELVAPTLWSYEVVASLRKAVATKWLTPECAESALKEIMALGIQQIPPTLELHRQALEWANRIHQVVAYDAAYLALAESSDAEFWTTDARLAESARKAGAKWAHGLDIQSSRSG